MTFRFVKMREARKEKYNKITFNLFKSSSVNVSLIDDNIRHSSPSDYDFIAIKSPYLMDLRQNFSEVGVYFPYISCCGFTRF